MKVELDGNLIKSEIDFHWKLAKSLGVERGYGFNCDALWDILSASVDRPLSLIWGNSAVSRAEMGDSFERIVAILERVRQQDEKFGWVDRFTYALH
ncbi:barstar family protein [Ralstonia solanacearum]|uniref:Barnase inhibitor n=1 Tax=Ralstonia solanacearum TaxID=305 RepID=A0A5H2PVS4_RALSL|nr:barstar family protein [Ralstonia solanacearum]AYB62797.1 barnase inhibitor [Ralstonia solanacearum]MBB6589116.1 barstar family protein [Ralstonia solanacearum]MCG3577297.1 barstar family protein [Ralstonia solanacearum]MCL9826291.1 barstar family protein [Ralstonia solanacearum]MCL9829186.1 barstar family protein [Ralstonia solanacearum]